MLLALAVSASADSLWTSGAKSITADPKARQVGDTITVLIAETSSSTQKASTDYSKDLEHGNSAGIGPIAKMIPEISVSSSQSGGASGSTSKSMNFSAQITAKVIKVQPNGNLEIEGTRTVQTNDEKQEITLTGTVRPENIASDNTVISTYLSDAKIKATGKGPIGDRQKEGIISKLLKFLF
jgi:flagellar L-ring protein precursor FlgH